MRVAAAAWLCAVAITSPAVAQQQLEPQQLEAPPAQTPNYRPGFLDTVNRWFGNSKAAIDEQLQQTQKRLGTIGNDAQGVAKGAAGVAQEAAGAVVALPAARIVNGRQTCATAPNGAPNCQPAVDALCRTRGFTTGNSLEISSAQKCSARVWLYGSSDEKSKCPVETYVTRALCQ